jgi:hypothetical protein
MTTTASSVSAARRRVRERKRLRLKRLGVAYLAKERVANAARMRKRRASMRRCSDRQTIAEARV